MKKYCFLIACLAALGLGAAVEEDASVLTIGTIGPDVYADGKTVCDGESYALVWRAKNHAFAGFTADGKVAEPAYARILCIAPLAKGGHCPETTFVVDSAVLAACGGSGTFGLYLLDSRRWGEDGSVVPGGVTGVHGSVLLSETSSVDGFLAGNASAPSAFLASALPEGVDQPRITDIRVEAKDIVITVEGTAETLNYNIAGGESAAADDVTAAAERPVAGDAQPIVLRVSRARFGGRAFFKAVRNPL